MSENLPIVVKQKIRVITMVWGENYLSDFLSMALPSLLAPGNLPALAREMDCEVVIVTEECLFSEIEASPVYRRIFSFCDARLVMCDDLVVSRRMYGHSLTHALHRGFEDLGNSMTEYYLAFFNADFILADGCYRTMLEKIKNGERLIFAPSYCTISEQVTARIQSRVNPVTNALSISPREMAEHILTYRHNCIRAKTVNHPFIHMNISDQFYWYVDEKTLLGHQLPIAIVCMKPENVYLEPVSFWDYSTISMACPTLDRCILSDSDDFLMMELRGEKTHLELMRIGHVSKEEIAEVLGSYMTPDQFEMGHYSLTLHSGELPNNVDLYREKLKEYVDSIYDLLPELPVSHFEHPYWTGLIDQFKANQLQWRIDREKRDFELASPDKSRISEAPKRTPITQASTSLAGRLYGNMFGSLPHVTMLHPRWADFRHVLPILDSELQASQGRVPHVLLVESDYEERVISKRVMESDAKIENISAFKLQHGDHVKFAERFDFCFMDLSWPDMNNFVLMYERLLTRIRPGGKVVAFHASDILRSFTDKSVREVISLVPANGIPNLYFSGSPQVADVIDSYRRGLQRLVSMKRGRSVAVASLMTGLSAKSYRANRAASSLPSHEVPEGCTSITIEVEVR